MLLAIYKDADGVLRGGLYDYTENYFRETFSPEVEELFLFDFEARGKSYRERKEYVRDFAKDFSLTEQPDWSWGELMYIQGGFADLGRRFGLLTEFHENCIC